MAKTYVDIQVPTQTVGNLVREAIENYEPSDTFCRHVVGLISDNVLVEIVNAGKAEIRRMLTLLVRDVLGGALECGDDKLRARIANIVEELPDDELRKIVMTQLGAKTKVSKVVAAKAKKPIK